MSEPLLSLRSGFTGQAWPALPAARGAALLALMFQLERSERLDADALDAAQLAQLARLVAHARAQVPFYRERLAAWDADPAAPLTAERWRTLPLLTRREVQSAGAALAAAHVPAACGATFVAETSGSTGEPVRVRQTAIDRLLWEAQAMRAHYWHRRDFSGRLAVIRIFDDAVGKPPGGTLTPNWGAPAAALHATGPMARLALTTDVEVQAGWLRAQDPDYLLTYPTNLAALLDHAAACDWRLPRLREVRTVGETVSPELRARCRDEWGVPLVDVYSSRELGYIAIQCPAGNGYHVTAETIRVEVLDDAGQPVAPGTVGRVVVTPLHNFATPLVRYVLNDYAEPGAPCGCGRGLPTLARIVGRSRNLVVLPDGRRHWPVVGFAAYRAIAPIRQYQLVQHSLTMVEVRLVVDRPLSTAEETALGGVIRDALGHAFALRFTYLAESIPRGPGGKFEEFISLVGG